jgi:enterochelin esterase-like enzyme
MVSFTLLRRCVSATGALFLVTALSSPASAYPRINPDGTVEFSFVAPNAAAVTLQGDVGNLPLTRQANGRWTGVLALNPEIYRYAYRVDGILTPDPDNLNVVTGYGPGFPVSYFEVPGDGSKAYEFRPDVEYGRIERVDYYSPVLKRMRQMHVFTPREYDAKKVPGHRKRYPVLYLLGGVGESDSQWSSVGRAGVILQNLIAEGHVEPMIVVMPNGRIDDPGQVNPPGVDIGDELLDAVIPFVDEHYRTKTRREFRALAGLSLGGYTVLQHGFTHLETFSHLGVFSSALLGGVAPFEAANQHILTDPGTNERLALFWFALGTQDFLYPSGQATLALFDKYGIDYAYYENNLGHDWFSWREFLTAFAPLLFSEE